MRVLLSIFSINEQILHVKKNLQALGCEVKLVYSDSYKQICPYYMKKIDELGFHFGKQRYLKLVQNKIYTLLKEFHPDIVLFVNPPIIYFSPRISNISTHFQKQFAGLSIAYPIIPKS